MLVLVLGLVFALGLGFVLGDRWGEHQGLIRRPCCNGEHLDISCISRLGGRQPH